jgi:hypothetical protein
MRAPAFALRAAKREAISAQLLFGGLTPRSAVQRQELSKRWKLWRAASR